MYYLPESWTSFPTTMNIAKLKVLRSCKVVLSLLSTLLRPPRLPARLRKELRPLPYIFPSPGNSRTMQGLPRFSTFLSYVPPLLRREMNETHIPVNGIPSFQPSPTRRVARHLHFPDHSGPTFTALHPGSLSYGPHFASSLKELLSSGFM